MTLTAIHRMRAARTRYQWLKALSRQRAREWPANLGAFLQAALGEPPLTDLPPLMPVEDWVALFDTERRG